MADVHDAALIELHLDGPASAASTGRALPRLIDHLRADGFRFVTVPEMLAPCGAASGERASSETARSGGALRAKAFFGAGG